MVFGCAYIDRFTITYNLFERQAMSQQLRDSRPNHFPMIVDVRVEDNQRHGMNVSRNKFLMPFEENIVFLRRKFHSQINQINQNQNNQSQGQSTNKTSFLTGLKSGQAVHLYSLDVESGKSKLIFKPNSASLESIYQEHKSPDGFLYIIITTEDTFGYPL